MTEAAPAVGTADGVRTGGSDSGETARVTAKLAVLWHRLPFTTTVVMAMLMLSVATGALWRAAEDHTAYPLVAYGLPSLEAGHWWTLVTGPFFAVVPWFYLPMVGSFALFAGIAEWRLGTRRAMVVTIGGQLVSVLVALQFLALYRGSGWVWADRLATTMDVGFSGGALFAMAVASASLRAPWRLRVRAGLCVYAGVAIIYVGTLADLVHFFALVLGLPLGRLLVGPHRVKEPSRPTLRERRLLAVSGLLLVTVAEVVMYFVPGDGPFGSSADMSPSGIELAVLCVVVLPVLNGLRKGSQFAWRWAIGLTLFAMAQVLLIGGLIAVAHYLGGDFDAETPSLSLVDNLLWTVEFVLLIGARDAFRAPSRRRRKRLTRVGPGPAIARALLGHNGGSTLSWMTTWPQNSYFVTADGRSYLAYQQHAGAAIALGDPIAPDGKGARAITEFAAMCEDSGLVPCVFSATATTIEVTRELGWKHVQVAEDTLIDLESLEFRGKAWQDVRTALNRAKKDGIEFRLVRLAEQPEAIVEQVRSVSEEWVSDKGMPEMGFTLGGVDEAMDPATRVGLAVDADGVVHGVTSWLPVHIGGGQVGGWTLDVMRRRADGFRPAMEFLIASACLAFREEGARFVSLSGAPLAHSSRSGPAHTVERALETLGALMEPYYGFRSLHAFKAKFQPRHEPLYLTFRDEADLPRIGLALQRAYLPKTGLLELAKMARKR
ncbi:bifunctional lysylphosphatidylglycerol flippase/synthetase MprF [Amycolatopsis sp. NPDC058986]|uniref:bifunctional lysylphosphatidylglycerol flippase/synthetase MprF n=1 Tax=unclassified Amycolatopsis TaxID=2618356 RepID=UPI00366F2B38